MTHEKFKFLIYFPLLSFILLMSSAGATKSQSALEAVLQIAYTPQNNIVALGLSNEVVELWDTSTNQLITTVLSPLPGANITYAIEDMSFSPNGDQIAISYGGYDSPGTLQIIDSVDGQILHKFDEGVLVGHVAWSPDGSLIAAKVRNGQGNPTSGQLLVWETISGNLVVDNYMGANISARGLDWSPDGTQLVSANIENTIVLWDTQSWSVSAMQFNANKVIADVGWTDDGLHIVAVDYERTVYVWDSTTGNRLHTINTGLLTHQYDIDMIGNQIVMNGLTEILIIDLENEPVFKHFPESGADVVWLDESTIIYSDANTFNVETVSSITSFALIHTANGTIFSQLNDGDRINSSDINGLNLSIRANTFPHAIGSVVFDLNGTTQTDDTAPYEFADWTPTPGQYILTATPYSESGGAGTAGTPLTIDFAVVDSKSP